MPKLKIETSAEPLPKQPDDVPTRVKSFQMVVGVDLIGSKMSMAATPNTELIDTGNAVVAISKKSGRYIKIPYTNIKGIELF